MAAPAPPLDVTPLTSEQIARLDGAVAAALAEGQAPGAVVAVVRAEGVAFLRAYGSRQIVPLRAPMADDAVFDLASLTKPFTALAVMRLAAQKKLRLSDPVARHRSSFARNGKAAITIAELLDHTSGLPAANALSDYAGSAAEALGRIDALPSHQRGTRRYSDLGYVVLGDLVARLGGAPLDEVIAREVTAPLGLTETGFSPEVTPRVVPTEPRDGVMLRGQVHDPRAARLGGAAGHAGLFSTARDLARLLAVLMRGGEGFLDPASLRRLHEPRAHGHGLVFSAAMGGYGHLGFTGTMLWVAPSGRTGVVLLTSRLHPDGAGDVTRLRQAVRRIVRDIDQTPVRTGADVVARELGPLRGRRVGLVANHTSRTRDGRRLADVLHRSSEVELVAWFAPEHGAAGDRDAPIDDGRDARTGVTVYSLYGARQRPTREALRGIDTLVFDLQDAGARFYTYVTTLGYVLEAAAAHGLRVVVLDRPNPLGGAVVEGPILDDGLRSFVGYHPLPIRHGLTVGELARLYVAERGLEVDLRVVAMEGWRRSMSYEQTGLPWLAPSPNLRTPRAARLYPGVALLEGTNLSVGRGTERPFEHIGAPWLDAERLAAALEAVEGVRVTTTRFTPTANKHVGERCFGLAFEVTDGEAFRPVRLGVALALALREVHPTLWRPAGMLALLGHRPTYDAILAGRRLDEVVAGWQPDLRRFLARRESALLYR